MRFENKIFDKLVTWFYVEFLNTCVDCYAVSSMSQLFPKISQIITNDVKGSFEQLTKNSDKKNESSSLVFEYLSMNQILYNFIRIQKFPNLP